MIYINAFLLSGLVCLIGEILFLKTKLSVGHITTLFVITGAILGGIGLYDILLEYCGGGASSSILNFGNLLVKGGLEGIKHNGILGMFNMLFKYTSTTLSFVIFISVLSCLIKK